ncbi:MAG: hypothetical protein AAF441_16685 [Pseudomonadota bacterium]
MLELALLIKILLLVIWPVALLLYATRRGKSVGELTSDDIIRRSKDQPPKH